MQVIKIAATEAAQKRRELYQLIEQLDVFSLVDCSGREVIQLDDITDTLVLDNFSKANDESAILKQVVRIKEKIKILILVDDSVRKHSTNHRVEYGTFSVIGNSINEILNRDKYRSVKIIQANENVLVELKRRLMNYA